MKDNSIYKRARKVAGLTRERASEYLNLSVETLASYEKGRRTVPDDVVVAMADLYSHQLLGYQHLRNKELGKLIPVVEERCISQSAVMLLQSMEEMEKLKETLLKIAYDNVISEDEKEDFYRILKSAEKLSEACMTLKYCKERSENE